MSGRITDVAASGDEEVRMSGLKIAYTGIEGAFAHIVARKLFPGEAFYSFGSFKKAYEAVENEECDMAVLPIENSYSGEVNDVMDLLFEGRLYVNALYALPVVQNLLGIRGSRIQDIKKVVSQPKALEQCDEYIRSRGYEVVQATNTAVAARQVAQMEDISVAAIASIETAAIYGLKVLDEQINERDDNTTRFVVVSRDCGHIDIPGQEKSFIVLFTVNNTAGSLLVPLQIIADNGYNMKVLHSRPLKSRRWEYYFYVEIEGDVTDPRGQNMMSRLEEVCPFARALGPYYIVNDNNNP